MIRRDFMKLTAVTALGLPIANAKPTGYRAQG